MRTRITAKWLVLLLPLLAAIPAGAAAESLQAVHVEGAPEIDGNTGDAYWSDVQVVSLQANGQLDESVERTMEVRLAHNGTHLFIALTYRPEGGTHPDDLLRFALAADDAADAAQHGWNPGTDRPYVDLHWTGSSWLDDASASCSTDGTGARGSADGSWTWELVRPFTGDACDLELHVGDPLRLRLEVRENMPFAHPSDGGKQYGDNFRWPQDTPWDADAPADWATLTIATDGTAGDTAEPTSGTRDDPASSGGHGAADGPGHADAHGDDAARGDEESEAAPLPLAVVLVALWVAARRSYRRA